MKATDLPGVERMARSPHLSLDCAWNFHRPSDRSAALKDASSTPRRFEIVASPWVLIFGGVLAIFVARRRHLPRFQRTSRRFLAIPAV